jgi:hypothetical protein
MNAEKIHTYNVCRPVNFIHLVRSLTIQHFSDSDLSLISLEGTA